MADIAMCVASDCPQREHCYRFTAPKNPYWQSYAHFRPDEFGRCADFVDNGIGGDTRIDEGDE